MLVIERTNKNFPLELFQESTINYPSATSTFKEAQQEASTSQPQIQLLGAVVLQPHPQRLMADYYIGINNQLVLVTYDTYLKEIQTKSGTVVARQWKWAVPNSKPTEQFWEELNRVLGPMAFADNPSRSIEGVEVLI